MELQRNTDGDSPSAIKGDTSHSACLESTFDQRLSDIAHSGVRAHRVKSCLQNEVNILQRTQNICYNDSSRQFNNHAFNMTIRNSEFFYFRRIKYNKLHGTVFRNADFRWKFFILLKLNVVTWSNHA